MESALKLVRLHPTGHVSTFEWGANALIIFGAALISVLPSLALSWHVFAAFFLGHLIWCVVGIVRSMRSLAALNLGMMMLDIYAISIRLSLTDISMGVS